MNARVSPWQSGVYWARDARAFWFLGPATCVKHEREAPMAITWRLQHALPGDLFEQFAAAVA